MDLGILSVGVAAPLAAGTPPAVQTPPPIDFPNPQPPRPSIELRTWLQPTPLNLVGQDVFYGGPGMGAKSFDYPNPRGYIPSIDLKTWIQSTPLNLAGKDKFYGVGGPTYDYPNPRGYIPAIDLKFIYNSGPALLHSSPTFGLGGYPNFDQPNPRGPRRAVDLLTWINQTPLNPILFPGIPSLAFSSERAAFIVTAADSPSGQGWKGPGFMAKYELDSSIQISGSFINSITGVYIDPTGVTLLVLDPSGLQSSFSYTGLPASPIVRDSQGHYHYTLTASRSGTWIYKWQASGTAVATSPDTTFVVNASSLISG